MEVPIRDRWIFYCRGPERRNRSLYDKIQNYANYADVCSGYPNRKIKEVKNMMLDTIEKGKGKWYRAINGYRNDLELSWDDLKNLDKPTLKNIIQLYDTKEWEKGMAGKISLRFYIQEKSKIKYEFCYRNNRNSLFFARARTNSIKLEEHKGRGLVGYDKTCKLCKEGNEDIVHFIIDCRKLERIRNYSLIDKDIQCSEEKMRKLLFRDNRFQEIGKMIKNLWTERRKILETNKKNKKTLEKFKKGQISLNQEKKGWLSDPGPGRGGCGYLSQRDIQRGLSKS